VTIKNDVKYWVPYWHICCHHHLHRQRSVSSYTHIHWIQYWHN